VSRRVQIILILLLVSLCSCIKKVERPAPIDSRRYYPLHVEDIYVYSGKFRTIATSGEYDGLFTRTYLDSTGDLLMWEDVKATPDGVFLNSRIMADTSIPEIHFEPPFPIAPWSNLVGDTLLFTTWEIRSDSINSHIRANIECEVVGIENLSLPAGDFSRCIKVRVNHRIVDTEAAKLLDGESFIWYARDVGIVKFVTPTENGELLQATIGDKTYPIN